MGHITVAFSSQLAQLARNIIIVGKGGSANHVYIVQCTMYVRAHVRMYVYVCTYVCVRVCNYALWGSLVCASGIKERLVDESLMTWGT